MPRTLTISGRIAVAEILAMLIILGVGATALTRTLDVARRVERFAGEQFPDALLLAQIAQGRLEADRAASAAFALAGRRPELRAELDGDLEIAFTSIDEGMRSYEARVRPAELGPEWHGVVRAIQLWKESIARFLEGSRYAGRPGGSPDPADDASLEAWQVSRRASQEAEAALLSYMTLVAGEVQQVRLESTSSTRTALWIIGLAVLVAALGHVMGGRLLRRSVGESVAELVGETGRLEWAVANGQLDMRGDAALLSAEFRPVLEGMNEVLDAFVAPLRLTARHIEQIAGGDIPEIVSQDCRGEFETIQSNLNRCVEDLTRNRAHLADAQRQLLRADRLSTIGTLASGMAHELNSPLAAIVADLSYLTDEMPAVIDAARRNAEHAALPGRVAELEEVLAEARAASRRVTSIVRDLATVARTDPAVVPVTVAEVIEAALALGSSKLGAGVRVVRDLGDVPQVKANEAQLVQVLLHLVVNAAQAIASKPGGEGEIRIMSRADEYGGVVVEVSDDGPGIDPAAREDVFRPFFTTRPPGAGTGLGLAVSHGIVLGLGGLLEVESEPGRGSLFRVVLPGLPRDGSAEITAPARAAVARVLVVSPDPQDGPTLARLLPGNEVVAVSGVAEALDAVRGAQPFDGLLCDVRSAGLHRALREHAPQLAHRLAFLVGGAPLTAAQELLAHSGRPVLRKPVSLSALRALVAGWLAMRRPAP